jgi:hypothetical protein
LIKLSNAVPFDTTSFLPETNAIVNVAEQNGSQFTFKETMPGYYYSDPSKFKLITGKSYKLYITTFNKIKYSSNYQTLAAKPKLDTIYGNIESKTYYTLEGKDYTYWDVQGIQWYGKINSGNSPYVRFLSSLLVEYSYLDNLDIMHYCWIKKNPNDFFNLSEVKYNTTSNHQQSLFFLPMSLSSYGIYDGPHEVTPTGAISGFKMIVSFVFTLKQYQLNKDVYQYYQDVNEQLQAQNRIFDPINNQFKGNVYCQSNPDMLVFGIFEVSSVITNSYRISAFTSGKKIYMKNLSSFDVEKVPATNCVTSNTPDFWIR